MVKDINEWEDEVERLDAALERIETNRRTENPWTFPFETPEDFEEYARKARAGE